MRAMVFTGTGQGLQERQLPIPKAGPGEILLQVHACGVCHTDLHILDGELDKPHLPLVLGHQVVGRVAVNGPGVTRFQPGQRVGVPWLGGTDGTCRYCLRGQENLCEQPIFTGYTRDGGFAEYAVARQEFCFPLPDGYDDIQAAPLLCAGLIGYRAYQLAGPHAEQIGIYGFGAAAHIIAQVARHQGRRIYAFTRPGDAQAQALALRLGAVWAGSSTENPPEKLDAALIFAPVGALIPAALRATDKGGTIVCGGIHMSDIPSFPYQLLWEERVIRSVANLTRQDGTEFLSLAAQVQIEMEVEVFPLAAAGQALERLRRGQLTGAAVLSVRSF